MTTEIALDMVLKNTGRSIRDIAHTLEDFERVLGEHIFEQDHDGAAKVGLHRLDGILQSLDELALMLNRLGEVTAPALSVDSDRILAPVRLESLRNMIAPGSVGHEGPYQTTPSGEVQLF